MGMTIIKNYEMPSNCYMCDLHNYHECDLTGESIEDDYCWNGDSREKHCPLREVEAIPKADMVAMLTEVLDNVEEVRTAPSVLNDETADAICAGIAEILRTKIDKLKGEEK